MLTSITALLVGLALNIAEVAEPSPTKAASRPLTQSSPCREGLPYATAKEARAREVNVVQVAVDHVGSPRGVTGGPCRLTGDVVRSPGQGNVYAIRVPEPLPYTTSTEARANAAGVIEILVEHTAVPRQIHGGYCPVQGQVVRVVRGTGMSPRGRVDLVVPCVNRSRPGDPRRISEGAFAIGSRSLLYLSDRMELLDAERIVE